VGKSAKPDVVREWGCLPSLMREGVGMSAKPDVGGSGDVCQA
jgi:hypothetical protein